MDELLKDPAMTRRSNAVYASLKGQFGHSTWTLDGTNRCMLPPLKEVEARMLNVWKKNQKAKRDEAQNSAARALTQANDERDVDDELVTDDEDDEDDWTPGAAAAAPRGSGEDRREDGDVTDEDAHYGNLDGVGVSVLRQRLRDEGQERLASVKQSDLPAGTASSGAGKSEATRELLRRRLARVLAG